MESAPCKECIDLRQYLNKIYKGCHDHCSFYQRWNKKHTKDLKNNYIANALKSDIRVCKERALRKQRYDRH